MLSDLGSEGLKSNLDCLSRVSFLTGKSAGRHLVGKRGGSLGIQWEFGV